MKTQTFLKLRVEIMWLHCTGELATIEDHIRRFFYYLAISTNADNSQLNIIHLITYFLYHLSSSQPNNNRLKNVSLLIVDLRVLYVAC